MKSARRILAQVTLPAVVIGLLFLGTCLVGVWSINRLQANRAKILHKNVQSLQAAQRMEIGLRQLRFHVFVYLMDPTPRRWKDVDEDDRQFKESLRAARALAEVPAEHGLVGQVEAGYLRYRRELDQAVHDRVAGGSRADLLRWADKHPVRHLQRPCEELLRVNQEEMDRTARQSESVAEQGRVMLILLGLLGPVGGLISGFGVAWGLSRSITRLRVRLEDVHARLGQELGSVRLTGEGGDLSQIEGLLEQVAGRVREVAARSQQQHQEMVRAEQLAAVGQLAASVAHEVRNPLTSIKLLVSAALRTRPPRALSAEDLRVIHDEVSRLEGKVQSLLDFARPPEAVRQPCDLRELVRHALDLVRARVRQVGVQAQLDLPDEPVLADLDRDQFTSVLVNLFLNALDAMPRGGKLSVTCAPRPGEVRLEVADTGGGIDRAVADRLFTPFTSTKPTGTGLGLSVCRRVVREHGGTLAGANRPEGGARFTITLPVNPRGLPEVSHADAAGG